MGLYFINSMPLKSGHIKREKQNRVFKGITEKSTISKFYGFMLYLVIDDIEKIVFYKLMGTKINERKVIDVCTENITSKLISEEGYVKNYYRKFYGKEV